MTESDNALMLRVAREEIKRQAAEIEYLKARLEVSPDHDYDGIASRDETIRMQDDRIAALREQEPVNARLLDSAKAALEALTCSGEQDDPGHRCGHCDDYVDRNGVVRASLRAAIAAAEAQQAEQSGNTWKSTMENEIPASQVRIFIKNTHTGETREYKDHGLNFFGSFIWEEGNYSCDCNRSLFFDRAAGCPSGGDRTCGEEKFRVRIEDTDGRLLYEDED